MMGVTGYVLWSQRITSGYSSFIAWQREWVETFTMIGYFAMQAALIAHLSERIRWLEGSRLVPSDAWVTRPGKDS